jgi:carbonic anhydrase/acetyltransferase-like protein (isoleucine patch superfamily)
MTNIIPYLDKAPKISDTAKVLPSTTIVGDVEIGDQSSIWFGTVLRGDVNYIRIGNRTNIQDNTVVHVTSGGSPTIIGDDVTIGHSAVIHACTIEDRVLVGMGAIIMDDVVVEKDCLIGAGSLLPPGKVYPSGHLIKGSPAKAVRKLNPDEFAWLKKSASHYVNVSNNYK